MQFVVKIQFVVTFDLVCQQLSTRELLTSFFGVEIGSSLLVESEPNIFEFGSVVGCF